jgi:phage gpG-like protein
VGVRIELSAFGDDVFSRELLRFSDRAEDMRPAFALIHNSFLGVERRQFSTEGTAYSGGWAPLAESTRHYKERHGLDPRILHATLALRDSLTSPNNAGHIYQVTRDSMFVGSSVPYGVFHQSRAPRTRLPRRPPVQLSEDVKKRWVKIIQSYLVRGE